MLRLLGHFNAGRFGVMESEAAALAARFPADGQAWKAWGIALLVQGKDALQALQRAVALLPGDAELRSNLGTAFFKRGELEPASACYQEALHLEPDFAEAHSNLGDVFVRLGQWPLAEASCRQALRLRGGRLPAAHLNLGNALKGQGRLDEAAASYREAVAGNPGQAEAHFGLGLALQALGQMEPALASLQQAARLRPTHGPTHEQLGAILLAAGRPEEAVACLMQAVQCQPELAAAHCHLANALADLGRHAQAIPHFGQALALGFDHAEVRANLGVALMASGRPEEAVIALQRAAEMQPGQWLIHNNLGNAHLALNQVLQAQAAYQRALDLAPDAWLVHSNLGHLLKTMGQPEPALRHLEQARALAPERPALHSQVMFVRQYLHPEAPSERIVQARRFAELAGRLATPYTHWPQAPQPDRCLRIGFVSGDLRLHPVGYFIESVLKALAAPSAGRPILFAYANQRESDGLTQRLKGCFEGWREVAGMDDAALAACIRADGIDVLVDLAGHTQNNRLTVFAWKPAPVQVSWLGYCATTGLPAIDAFIADPWMAPPGAELAFVERLVRLPETFLCFTPPEADVAVGPLPALAGGGVRFGCFNHLAKINDDVVALWSAILRALPQSRLVLQSQALQDDEMRERTRRRFAGLGVEPQRLWLQGPQARADYLAAYRQIDIALDPFPYPGGTTSLEALWMGVPVLTLQGATALSRQGSSILHNMGLPGWVAANAEEYLSLALQHAADLPALAALRQGLRQRLLRSPLCDAPGFAHVLHAGLRGLWVRWCEVQLASTRPGCSRP